MTLTLLEQQLALGVFTHRTTYLPGLMDSIARCYPGLPLTVIRNDAPIVTNMELLRQAFLRTKARFWCFLDDDIEFLGEHTLHNALLALIRNNWAGVSVYQSYNPTWGRENYAADLAALNLPAEKEVGWMTGYFVMVDAHQVGHIQPDQDLPDPNTAIDTSYSVAIRAAGGKIGLVPEVVYHTWKDVKANVDVIHTVEAYLKRKWGAFYQDCVQYTGCVVEWPR